MLPLIWLWSCTAETPDAADTLTILFSSRGEGEIEPCG